LAPFCGAGGSHCRNQSAEQFGKISDDRYLSTLALRVVYVPVLESTVWWTQVAAFRGGDSSASIPNKVVLMGGEQYRNA